MLYGQHITGSHDSRLVLLAVLIAVLASYTTLDIGNRIKSARGVTQLRWLAAGAGVMGGGIWSMHFIAMLAFTMPIPLAYDSVLTAGSLLVAVVATGIALFIVSRRAASARRILAAGGFMGLGIAAMHYVGMAAVRLPAEIHYVPSMVILSIAIAVAAATAALWLAFTMEGAWRKFAASLLMGGAISGMHFTGMAAAHYSPAAVAAPIGEMALSPVILALIVAVATLYVLCLTLLSSIAHGRLSAAAAQGAWALQQSEQRHHSLVQNSFDIIAILDDSGAFTYCSRSSHRILGYAAAWLIGHRLVEFLQPEDVTRFEEIFSRAEQPSAGANEFRLRHADGTWRMCDVICNNLKDDPTIGGVVINLRDTTERHRVMNELRKAKTQAEQANHTKSEFLAAMSHELRTPLNAVIGFSDVIKSGMLGGEAGPRCIDYASHIHDSAHHLLGIINDILDLSKAESGQMPLIDDYCRPADIIASSMQMLKMQAEGAEVTLESGLPGYLPYLYGDKRRILQALVNVLSNAVKFTKPGGRVEIGAAVDDQAGLIVTVRDTGIGMASDEIAMALEPFRQVDSSLNRRYEGIGLGLPLTRNLIELHGGSLHIDSFPGRGTCVSLRFPPERVIWSQGEDGACRLG